jgi:hypothetical protein
VLGRGESNDMMENQRQLPPGTPSAPRSGETGPVSPRVAKPDIGDLLKRMKRVDPDQARRYRQRTGE